MKLPLFHESGKYSSATTRHLARNFDWGAKQEPTLNISIYNAPCFQKHIIHQMCLVLAPIFLNGYVLI